MRQEQIMSQRSTNDHDSQSVLQLPKNAQVPPASDLVNNYGQLSGFIPGLNFIRNSIIKPLLFASEKVVESYIHPEQQPQP